MADTINVTPAPNAAAAAAVEATQAKNGMQQTAPEPEATPEVADTRLEAFARKERQLHKMRKELEAEKAAIKSKITEYETGYVPKSRLTADPFGVLNEAGLGYDKLTEMLLEAPNMNDPAIRALMGKIKALEDKQGEVLKQQEAAQAKQYTDAISQIGNEVKQIVSTDDAYEMIRETGLHEAVVELIEQTYTSEGRLMDTAEACKQVEDYLLVEAERLAKSKKVQARLKPEPVSQPLKTPHAPNQIKTLTNAVSATPTRRLSNSERIERAKAAFNGQLKG